MIGIVFASSWELLRQISKIAYLAVEVIPYSIEYGANCTLPDPQERGEESDETDEISGSFDSESD